MVYLCIVCVMCTWCIYMLHSTGRMTALYVSRSLYLCDDMLVVVAVLYIRLFCSASPQRYTRCLC